MNPLISLVLIASALTLQGLTSSTTLAGSGSTAVAETAPTRAPWAFDVKVSGHGRPVILIPGLGCSGAVWNDTVKALSDQYELHVLTLAGFAGQPAIGEPFLPRVHDDIVRYVREHKLDRPVVIGHSLGGFMAFWLSSNEPDLFGPIVAVDGVPFLPALMNPQATVESAEAQANTLREMLAKSNDEAFEAQMRASLQAMITAPADVERVFATARLTDPAAEGQAIYEVMTTDLRPKLSRIEQPVLLIGAGGALPPSAIAQVTAAYKAQIATVPRHEFVMADKARHFVMLDDPSFFQQTLARFLRDASR